MDSRANENEKNEKGGGLELLGDLTKVRYPNGKEVMGGEGCTSSFNVVSSYWDLGLKLRTRGERDEGRNSNGPRGALCCSRGRPGREDSVGGGGTFRWQDASLRS